MDSASDSSGFSSHVLNQFHEMSQQAASRGRGSRGRGRGQGQQPPLSHGSQATTPFTMTSDSFPPLGSRPSPAPSSIASHQSDPHYQPEPQPTNFNHARHGTPREYQERARGNQRGGRHFHPQQPRPQQFPQQSSQPVNPAQSHNYARPQPRHAQLYQPNASMHYGTAQQQRVMRHAIIRQSDYLTGIGRKAYDEYKFTQEEKDVKDRFRLSLEEIARNALAAKFPDLQLDQVKLKCYGSLANGFALKNCDMDLLLTLPDYEEPGAKQLKPTSTPDGEHVTALEGGEEEHSCKADVQRILEKAFLDHEYGARLLTQTRVPILRICQSPTPDLLQNLRQERSRWEQSIDHTGGAREAEQVSETPPAEPDALEQAMTDLSIAKTGAKRGNRGNAGLEFTDQSGIQCDVNFSNFVALHNSTLLRLYHSFDPRVKEVGVFVKIWAKTRDINTPYRGTLSSYGWILMVLHYLMNVARPPVVPNLQYLAKTEDSWNPDRKIELFEGFDVRFVRDPQSLQDVRQDMAANQNRESSGQLLRGFFQYYATHQGFHWTRDVVTIRTKGGVLSKQAKGWTEAKWQQGQTKTVRNRYLLAIEDPFEIEHNIARTVGHHGVVRIRDEFRRAWAIIEKIGTDTEIQAEELLSPVTDRVDTLKKDQEAYKIKQTLMRQEMEAKEKAMLQQGEVDKTELQTDGTWGDSDQGKAQTYSSPKSHREPSKSKLTSTNLVQERKQVKTSSWRRRKVSVDSDDEGDSISTNSEMKQESAAAVAPPVKHESKKRNEGLTSRAEVLLANGYDREGNPVAWDIETQEGRWLRWRDVKVVRGTLGPFLNETLRELHEQCPYDSRRPNPYAGKPRHNRFEMMAQERPPWPANSSNRDNGTPTAPSPPHRSEDKIPDGSVDDSGFQSKNMDLPGIEALASGETLREIGDGGQGKPTSVTNRAKSPEPQVRTNFVGTMIPWDRSTVGGRWLSWRDRRVVNGGWQERERDTNEFARLNSAFPYNPNMTCAELEEKNEILRRAHMHSITAHQLQPSLSDQSARGPASSSQLRASSSGVVRRIVVAPEELPSQDAAAQEEDVALQLDPSVVCSSSSPNAHSSNTVPWSDGQPSQITVSDKAPNTPPDSTRVPDVDFLRMQRLAFFTKHMNLSKSEIDTNERFYLQDAEKDSADMTSQEVQTPVASRSALARLREDEGRTEADDEKAKDPAPPSGNNFSDLSVDVSDRPIKDDFNLRVPATLYPGADKNSRPPDEDPNIMPIPRSIGFQFDPRQMQDLAVISKGGNGCARAGAEFNIESDAYEWGGGGMMGYRTDTGPQLAGTSSRHTQYEAGRGDDEGLLNELPRHWNEYTTTDC